MTDATVRFYNIPSLDGRVFPLGDYRQLLNGVVIGLGTVAAVCALVTIVMVAAAWIFNTALATNPYIHAHAPLGSGIMAFAQYGPTLASAADVSKSARVSTAPADAPDVTFEAKWARAMAFARVSAVPLVSEHPRERASNVPSPPLDVPQSQAKSEIAHAPNLTHVATLTPAAAPASPLPSTPPLPRKRTPEWSNTLPLPRPHPSKHEIAGSPLGQTSPQVAAAKPPAASTTEKRVTAQQIYNKSMSPSDPDSRTAIYDISARTVYLPNGEKLEAHSGLGDKRDDPQYIHV
jgi:hypothetical protein